MKPTEIAQHRQRAQQIGTASAGRADALVQFMGAMQAQDYAAVKWALGIRLPSATLHEIETAFSQGHIIRTHVLRPTWHIAAAEDIHWMLMLTAPKIRSGMNARHKELELDDAVLRKTNRILEKTLSGGQHLTREEVLQPIVKAGIRVNENRSSHILMWAELEGILGSGGTVRGKYTYALLDAQVKNRKHYAREEALALLGFRYFTSHGPATLRDFTWWSGLPAADARIALELNKARLETFTLQEQEFWHAPLASASSDSNLYLLPAYDEFLISYADRQASIAQKHHAAAVSNNGIFRPILVRNGKVLGTWKAAPGKTSAVEPAWFEDVKPASAQQLSRAVKQFTDFRNE